MAEYIEREAFRDELLNISIDISDLYGCGVLEGLDRATKRLNEQPPADVAPVRHGRWIFGKDLPYSWGQTPKNKYHLYCSECLEQAFNRSEDNDPDFDVDTPYCPNCGAMMDLSDECKQDGER